MHVSQEKQDALGKEMERLHILEEDLIEKYILGSGKGGQKVNKSHSCVYLKHVPTGIEVKCSQERSRELNRYFARRILCEKIAGAIHKEQTEKDRLIDKIRKQKKRRKRRIQHELVEGKRDLSKKKALRKPPAES